VASPLHHTIHVLLLVLPAPSPTTTLISLFSLGKISHTILHYSDTAFTAMVHMLLLMLARGMKLGPPTLHLVAGQSKVRAMARTNAVLKVVLLSKSVWRSATALAQYDSHSRSLDCCAATPSATIS